MAHEPWTREPLCRRRAVSPPRGMLSEGESGDAERGRSEAGSPRIGRRIGRWGTEEGREGIMRGTNRRSFIAGLAAATAAPSFARTRRLHAAAPAAARRFKLGTVTYNLAHDWTLDRLIENCEAAGYEGVELRTTHAHAVEPTLSPEERAGVRRRFEQTEVRLVCLGSVAEFHSPDPSVVAENIAVAGRFVDLAADVGAAGVRVRPNGLPESVPVERTLEQIGRALAKCGEAAERRGVEIWMEVHGRGSSHPPHIHRMLEICGHPSVGITWNSNPTDLLDGRIEPYFELLRPWIRNVHINELITEYPYKDLFRLLRETGFEGYTLAEIPGVEGDPLRFMRYYRRLWETLSESRT
jgi:sugar phosphate isomerase/epimerase